jgi:hypothetical protein
MQPTLSKFPPFLQYEHFIHGREYLITGNDSIKASFAEGISLNNAQYKYVFHH